MSTRPACEVKPVRLGIETGATHSTVLLVEGENTVLDRFDLGPGNIRLLTSAEVVKLLEEVRSRLPKTPTVIGAGFAGLRNDDDRRRVLDLAQRVWPSTPFIVTDDLETALESAGPWPDKADARVLLLSGTGSCAYGRNTGGKIVKIGGRGHILGDQGSACDIALQALRAIVYQHDVNERFPALGEAILRTLQLNHPDDLIPWTQVAEKQEIAHLAITIFSEAERGDALAKQMVHEAAVKLADMATHCAQHLVEAGAEVQFILAGSTLLKQPAFAAEVTHLLQERGLHCQVEKLRRESVWGAVELANSLLEGLSATEPSSNIGAPEPLLAEVVSLASLAQSPTEMRNPASMHLDTMPLAEAITLMVQENAHAAAAVLPAIEDLQWLIEVTVRAFKAGHRLFYVGAGTSGRLGVLDASECPPTFRVPAEQVQGIMAGGRQAIWSAVEGAEDNSAAGASAVRFRGVKEGDVVLGIAASGRTPYVWGALHEARQLGAVTALLCFNPRLEVDPRHAPDRILRIDTGPEVLTGSTRLKAGTATKVVLNTLTTLAMVHLGKVKGNLMVDLNASNVKLRDRAVRLVRELTGCEAGKARAALEANGWDVKAAVARFAGDARHKP